MEKYATAPHKERIVWLDLVKVMAIFMMIAVHCTDNVTPEQRSEPWYLLWGSLYGTFMRPAIPLFVMATGALLLPVKQNITAFYSRRMGRIVVPFLVWSLLYNLFPGSPDSSDSTPRWCMTSSFGRPRTNPGPKPGNVS